MSASTSSHHAHDPALSDQAIIKTFVQTVTRAFYDPPAIILLDQLLKKEVFRDDDLALHVGLTVKELGKVAGPLAADRLIKTLSRNEHKDGPILPHARPVSKTYYWIDRKEFCDVVRWRMDTLYKTLDKKLRTEQENKGYICTGCHKTYLPVDVPMNVSIEGVFLCDICGFDLADNEDADGVKGEEDKMASFNVQTAWIQEGLRKTGEIIFPAFDIHQWLAENTRGGEGNEKEDVTSVKVELQLDGDEARKAAQAAKVAAEQRSQNVIPAWHLYSTVSGQRTALGESHAALEAAMRGSSGPVVPSTRDDEAARPIDEQATKSLESYYSSLLAPPEASSPSLPSLIYSAKPEPPSSPASSADERETHQSNPYNPPVNFPSSAPSPSSRKRSFSDMAHAPPASAVVSSVKAERISPEPGALGLSGGEVALPGAESEYGESAAGVADRGLEETLVFVAGVQKPFSAVTEDDHELMTPDEYSAYSEVWMEANS